jgi:hypothetical protein
MIIPAYYNNTQINIKNDDDSVNSNNSNNNSYDNSHLINNDNYDNTLVRDE